LNKILNLFSFILIPIIIPIIIIYFLILQIPLAFPTSDPLYCPTPHLLDCYFKMIFKISKLNSGEKTSDFKINITVNPRHVDIFQMDKKTMVKYLLPGEYRISIIDLLHN
jgi:hypothetical protein